MNKLTYILSDVTLFRCGFGKGLLPNFASNVEFKLIYELLFFIELGGKMEIKVFPL